MGFYAPAFLLLLALAGLIIWLHSTQPSRKVVPSLHLWRTLQDRAGVTIRRRRLPPPSLLLFVQLAILLALVLALSLPFFGKRPAEHLVVVLDGSDVMTAQVAGEALFSEAKTQLMDELASRKATPPRRVSLLVATAQPKLIAARHNYEPLMAEQLLANIEPNDGAVDWYAVNQLVKQTLQVNESVELLYVGPATTQPDIPAFSERDNVSRIAIELPALAPRLDVRLEPLENGKWRLTGEVTTKADITQITVSVGFTSRRDIGVRPPLPWTSFKLKLTEGKARIDEKLTADAPGLLTITASAEDALAWSGAKAQFLTIAPKQKKILYLADEAAGDQPFIHAIMAAGNFELYRAASLPLDLTPYALVIVDGLSLEKAPQAHTVWLGAAGDGQGEFPTQRLSDADSINPLHALTREMDWLTPNFGSVSTRPLPENSLSLVSGSGYPLLAVRSRERWQDITIRFDPRSVNWRGSDLLPMLATAIGDWTGLTGVARLNCIVGQLCAATSESYTHTETAVQYAFGDAAFVPSVAGTFVSADGDVFTVNPAQPRFEQGVTEGIPYETERTFSPFTALVIAAILLVLLDIILRYRKSGKRSLPALTAAAFLIAGLLGLVVPVPFTRTFEVALVPSGHAAVDGIPTVTAGPVTALANESPSPVPATRISNVEPALSLAAALVPPYKSGLITAHAPIRADVSSSAPIVLADDIQLVQMPEAQSQTPAFALTALAVPTNAKVGDRLTLTALVSAELELPVDISFFANGTQLAIEDTLLVPGMNRIETELPPIPTGETLYTVAVSTQAGTTSKLSAVTTAHVGRPILVLAPEEAHGAAFASMIETDNAVVLSPASAPDYLRDYLGYDAIVLLNMPARGVSTREASLIETSVREYGLGLLALGGSNAFGPGGYYATPFEDLSPLSARVPREAPEVTMVFVLDRSGSMNQTVGAGTRLELARQATAGAIELLNPASQVGIVVFDNEARTVLPLTAASDIAAIKAALATVDTGGGTAIAPGLEAGWALLRGSQAQARHMIVMSDGLSLPGDFSGIASRMRDEGITVSAVAVGTEADTRAVMEIATAGGGSVHASSDFASLPSILSQEAMLLSAPVREGVETPRIKARSDEILRALPSRLPQLSGVVLTTEKPDAHVALTTLDPSGEEAPLLATWRYGNGSVLSFASDVTGEWSRNWQASEELSGFWPHVIRQMRPLRPANGPWLTLTDRGQDIIVTLDALDDDGVQRHGLSPVAQISLSDGSTFPLPLKQTPDGAYLGSFSTDTVGRIHASVTIESPARTAAARKALGDEQSAEAALYLNAPYWAAPIAAPAFATVGGTDAPPSGWGIRLVSGLSTPWLVLSLISFLIALFIYMRPPRAKSPRQRNAQASSVQGMAS